MKNRLLQRTSQSVLGLAGVALVVWMILPGFVVGQPVRTANLPAGYQLIDIGVDSVKGNVFYRRPPSDEFVTLTAASHLRQGDTLAADFGAVAKLLFQYRPTKDKSVKTSALIVKGYTEIDLHRALAKGDKTFTWIGMRQGNMRAGVVKTAKPPSYRVRTPQVVVAVRGTEIAELDGSTDLGPRFALGRAGLADVIGRLGERVRMGREQQTRSGSPLMRAVQAARLNSFATLTGANQSGQERSFAGRTWDNRGNSIPPAGNVAPFVAQGTAPVVPMVEPTITPNGGGYHSSDY